MNDPSTSAERILKFPAESPRYVEFGRFRLDCVEMQLFADSEPVQLPPKTLELLVLLAQRSGHLVTRESIMSALWPETFVEESNLTQHVFRLRKALDDENGGRELIETVPRRGYRFRAEVRQASDLVRAEPGKRVDKRRRALMVLALAAVLIAAAVLVGIPFRPAGRSTPPEISSAAHEAYLKGSYHFARRTVPDFRKALEYFRSAVEQEPRYALAWAGLADVYNVLGEAPRAKVAARRALEIDESLVQAHTALANVSVFYEFDWPAAERHFQRAIELDPSHPTAHHWYSSYLTAQGRFEDALAEIERALQLDPLSLIIGTSKAETLSHARRYDEAITKFKEVLALDAGFVQAHHALAETYIRAGDYEAAREELEKFPMDMLQAELFAFTGQRQKSIQLVRQAESRYRIGASPLSQYAIARMHAALGDREQTLSWLEKALTHRDGQLLNVKVDAAFDPFRQDPRFRRIIEQMNL